MGVGPSDGAGVVDGEVLGARGVHDLGKDTGGAGSLAHDPVHALGGGDTAGGIEGVDDAAHTLGGPSVGEGAVVERGRGVDHPWAGFFAHVGEDRVGLPDEAGGLESEAGERISGSDELDGSLIAGGGQGTPFLVVEVGQGEAAARGDLSDEAQDRARAVEPDALPRRFPGGQVGLGGVEVGGESTQGRTSAGRGINLFAHGSGARVPPALILVRFEVGEQATRLLVPDHGGSGGRTDHRGLCTLGQDRARNGGGAVL